MLSETRTRCLNPHQTASTASAWAARKVSQFSLSTHARVLHTQSIAVFAVDPAPKCPPDLISSPFHEELRMIRHSHSISTFHLNATPTHTHLVCF